MNETTGGVTLDEIAVTIIGGYLGSGKTTLVNHVLGSADGRVAVIVNDFGDINIDASLIASADEATISLANGCICCSLVDGFAAALDTVEALRPRPERLLIETSGVALPQQVAAWAHRPGFHLDAVVVVVDVETVRGSSVDRYVGDTVRGQIEAADVLIANKVDMMPGEQVTAVVEWLGEVNADAVRLAAEYGRVDLGLLFAVTGGAAAHLPSSSSSPASAALFTSRTIELVGPLVRADVESLMDRLPASIVRAKGWLRLTDEPEQTMLLQCVGRRWTLTRSSSDRPSSLVFIATDPGALDTLDL